MRNRDCVKKCLAMILSVSMAVQPGFIALAEETEQETLQSTEAATEAPQAEGSETETPVTEAAQTEAQATEAPETETLVTEAPETETPVTEEPETEAPETEAVQTEAPETETSQTQAEETEEPSAQAETQYTFKYQIYTWNEAQKRNTHISMKRMTSDSAVVTISMPDASSTPDVTVNGKKYVFKGWRVGRIGENNEIQTELQFAAGAAVTADVSELGNKYLMIYAVYEEQSTSYTYTLNYDGNGTGVTSVPSAQTDTNADGSAVFKVTGSKPVRPGYIFQGWAESADAAKVKYAAGDEIRIAVSEENQTKTLYAVWKSAMVGPQEDTEINVYVEYMDSSLEKGYRVDESSKKTVTVTCQNKTEHSKYTSHQVKYNDVVKAADVSGFAVEEGWEIVGIARNAGTNQSVFGLDNTFMQGGVQSPYNSFYLVAKKNYTYSLKYDGNGENVTSVPAVQEETTANGVAVFKVTGSKPVRPGYIFQGWAESADAAEVKYAAGDEIRVAVSEENQTKTLYAVWKSAMVGPQEDTEINVYVEYMDSSLEKGYRVDEASKKTVTVTCQNKTEHSKYTSHQVKYNDVVKAADVSGFTVEEGWEIVGIARNAGINQSVFGLDNTFMQGGVQSPYNSFYLVAKKQYTYSLKYDGNGENVTSVPSVQEETTANGVAVFKVTGSKPVRPGYIFQGWAESADAAEVKYAAGDEIRIAVKEENQRKTLYAVWKSAMVGPQEDTEINVYVEYMDSSLEKGYCVDESSKKTVTVTCQNKTEHSKYMSHQVKYNDVVKAADVSGFAVKEGWEIVGIARNAGTNQSVFGLDNTFMQGGVQSPYNSFYLVAKKKVSSVTLSKETLTLEFGAQETLTAELLNVKETTWTSSDDSVVTVAEDGTITAVGLGTAVVTCADKADANIKATCEVTVEDSTVLAAAVTIISGTSVKVTWNEVPSAESYQIYRLEVGNGSYEVAATAEAGETEWTDISLSAGKKYRYYTEAYATVNGEKKAIKKSAVRTCITPKITLSKTAMNLQYGKTATLKATKVGVKAVTWTSSDPKIAKVSANGIITAAGLGTVTITCTSKANEEISATCEVTVRDTTLLQMKATAGKTNNLLSWNKIPSADGYRIYGGECGSTMKLIKTVSAGTQSWNHSGLKAGKAYRYCVKAYRIVNGTETVTKTSNTVHSITASSKFTNAKSVTVSETSVALQVGESKNLGAKVVAADANRTLLTHTAELVYKSGSSKVATVSKDGTVTAVGKGTCRIYVTAGSGASATVTVTVK